MIDHDVDIQTPDGAHVEQHHRERHVLGAFRFPPSLVI